MKNCICLFGIPSLMFGLLFLLRGRGGSSISGMSDKEVVTKKKLVFSGSDALENLQVEGNRLSVVPMTFFAFSEDKFGIFVGTKYFILNKYSSDGAGYEDLVHFLNSVKEAGAIISLFVYGTASLGVANFVRSLLRLLSISHSEYPLFDVDKNEIRMPSVVYVSWLDRVLGREVWAKK